MLAHYHRSSLLVRARGHPLESSTIAIKVCRDRSSRALFCHRMLKAISQIMFRVSRGSTLHYRKLGPTGLDVSVIGFGASALGGVFGLGQPDKAKDLMFHPTQKNVLLQTNVMSGFYKAVLA
jgi:hypothetical protein